jgi:DNA repair protein RadC
LRKGREKITMGKRVPTYKLELVRDGSAIYDVENVDAPSEAAKLFRPFVEKADRELFLVAYVNNKNRPLGVNVCSMGSLDATCVTPREVFKGAILANAASVILGHNHPSGDIFPSPEDIDITKNLSKAGKILGIQVLDHIILGIVGEGEPQTQFSFKQEGML